MRLADRRLRLSLARSVLQPSQRMRSGPFAMPGCSQSTQTNEYSRGGVGPACSLKAARRAFRALRLQALWRAVLHEGQNKGRGHVSGGRRRLYVPVKLKFLVPGWAVLGGEDYGAHA